MADIDFGQLSEALNDKSDRDLRNVDTTAKADAVIDFQLPTADNGYTWYRKYKSGWCEQGGKLTQSGTATLPVEMSDTNYNLQVRLDYNNTGTIQGRYWYATKTTTGFTMAAFLPLDWLVCGKAAN